MVGPATQSSLKLSKTWPYAYDFENKQSLTGNTSPNNSLPLTV